MINRLIAMLQQKSLLLSDQEIDALSEAQSLLHDEDIADALWLAAKLGGSDRADEPDELDQVVEPDEPGDSAGEMPSSKGYSDTTTSADVVLEPPPPAVSAYIPPPAKSDAVDAESPAEGLPIQVQAAPALSNPRDIGRSLRPLMRKVPSLTRSELDEIATVNQIAERDIWVPILQPSPERWFDLELVIEANQFSFIWQDTLDEFQQLLECQGAFRNVRTWYVKTSEAGLPELVAKKQKRADADPAQSLRSHKELVDTSGRRLVLFVSDCRSELWRQGQIHDWLALWGQHGPAVVVQLLPERLWNQSELDVGFAVQVSALIPGAPNQKLQVRELPIRTEIAPANALTVPIMTLSAGALKQWALVVSAAGRQRSPARLFDLSWVKAPDRDRSRAVIRPESAKERVELFQATASSLAQRLASMMAAVPVELPVVHLIQQELLKDLQPAHIAEVYSSGLLEEVNPDPASPDQAKPDAPPQYDFVKDVRGLLNEMTPLDETLGVLEVLSQRIARTLGFEIKSFTALLSPKSDWSQEDKDAILPFAQIATEVLRRLGGDYAELAQLVEDDARRYLDWIKPPEPDFPDLEILEFTTAQLVESSSASSFPQLQTQEVEVVTIVFETESTDLHLFEFESATIEREPEALSFIKNLTRDPPAAQRSEWVIRKQRRQAQRLVEALGNGIQLEMVAIPAGRFLMGSPSDEPERSDNEGPQHEVIVSSFLMGRYPVTQAQWRFVAGLPQVNRRLESNPSNFKGDNRPVEQVSWHDAVEFCERLSVHTRREYRLPSEAEWEYTCRAGTTTPFHFGNTLTPELANYDGNYTYNDGPKGKHRKKTMPIGQFGIANVFGLCDMHGNVWEWCADHWHNNYDDAPIDGSSWLSEDEQSRRVRRGGSWNGGSRYCRSAYRDYDYPGIAYDNIGFRVVCSAPRTF